MVFQEFISTVARTMDERYKEMGQDYTVTTKKRESVNQENSISIVVKKPGQLQQPGIVMNSFYADFNEGKKKMDEIIDQLIKSVEEENLGIQLNGSLFTTDGILRNIRMELINADRNRELLSHVPHRMVADLAVIYKFIIQDTGEGIIGATLTNHTIAGMGIHEDELFRKAMCRLPRYLTKPRQRRSEWDMAGSDGISRVSAVFRGKSLLTNKMRII